MPRGATVLKKPVQNRIIKATKDMSSIRVRRRKPQQRRRRVIRNHQPRPRNIPLALLPNDFNQRDRPLQVDELDQAISFFQNELTEVKSEMGEKIKDKTSLDTECTICMENIICKDSVNLSCGHFFHQECVDSWSKTKGKKECPLCRTAYVTINAMHLQQHFKPTLSSSSSSISKLQHRISENIYAIDRLLNVIDLT